MSSNRVLQPPRDLEPQTRAQGNLAGLSERIGSMERASGTGMRYIGVNTGFGFTSPYVNYSDVSGDPSWVKGGWSVEHGRVFLHGMVRRSTGAVTGADEIWTMPAGLRPSKHHLFVCYGELGVGRVDVMSTGQVISRSSSGGSTGWISLDPINYRIA